MLFYCVCYIAIISRSNYYYCDYYCARVHFPCLLLLLLLLFFALGSKDPEG